MTGKSRPRHPNRKHYRCQTGENLTIATGDLLHIIIEINIYPFINVWTCGHLAGTQFITTKLKLLLDDAYKNNIHWSQKTPKLWDSIAQNSKGRFWWNLAQIMLLDFAEGWETENWCIWSKDLLAATAYPMDSQENEWQRAARNGNRPSTS